MRDLGSQRNDDLATSMAEVAAVVTTGIGNKATRDEEKLFRLAKLERLERPETPSAGFSRKVKLLRRLAEVLEELAELLPEATAGGSMLVMCKTRQGKHPSMQAGIDRRWQVRWKALDRTENHLLGREI